MPVFGTRDQNFGPKMASVKASQDSDAKFCRAGVKFDLPFSFLGELLLPSFDGTNYVNNFY